MFCTWLRTVEGLTWRRSAASLVLTPVGDDAQDLELAASERAGAGREPRARARRECRRSRMSARISGVAVTSRKQMNRPVAGSVPR